MSLATQHNLVSIDAYLAAELSSTVKHEYLGGVVYAMPGARNRHNRIASNALVALGSRLRGGPRGAYNSDTKIRIRLPNHVRFYYPDMSVVCRPNSPRDTFHDDPVVVVEVLSRGTRRHDEGEKKDAYLAIPSLTAYLLVEQESQSLVAFLRTEQGFVRHVLEGGDSVIHLPDLKLEVPLAELYEGVVPGSRGVRPKSRTTFLKHISNVARLEAR